MVRARVADDDGGEAEVSFSIRVTAPAETTDGGGDGEGGDGGGDGSDGGGTGGDGTDDGVSGCGCEAGSAGGGAAWVALFGLAGLALRGRRNLRGRAICR